MFLWPRVRHVCIRVQCMLCREIGAQSGSEPVTHLRLPGGPRPTDSWTCPGPVLPHSRPGPATHYVIPTRRARGVGVRMRSGGCASLVICLGSPGSGPTGRKALVSRQPLTTTNLSTQGPFGTRTYLRTNGRPKVTTHSVNRRIAHGNHVDLLPEVRREQGGGIGDVSLPLVSFLSVSEPDTEGRRVKTVR